MLYASGIWGVPLSPQSVVKTVAFICDIAWNLYPGRLWGSLKNPPNSQRLLHARGLESALTHNACPTRRWCAPWSSVQTVN